MKCLWLTILFWYQVNAAKILVVIPTPSISHQVVARPLVNELVNRGHEVTLITTDPSYEKDKAPANLTEVDVHDISYQHVKSTLLERNGKSSRGICQIIKYIMSLGNTLDLQLQTPEVQEILKKPKDYFDLLILESCVPATIGLSSKFKAPVIQFSTAGTLPHHYAFLGAPSHPILFPTGDRIKLYNLTRWEKVVEVVKSLVVYILFEYTKLNDIRIIRKHFGNDADFEQLHRNSKLLLLNEHPIWADNRPVSPNILFIGGMHQTPDVEMQKELKSYLDSSKNGVIYMSLGSNILTSALSEEKKEVIARVFARLPYDILLKWDDELPNQPSNVKVQKWFPQSTLLKHPNIKLFITQAGLQSTDEAINAGVPLLGIPMASDQWYNAAKYVRHKIGLQLDFETLDEDTFYEAIRTIVTDTSYKKNMLKLRTLMREFPVQPVDLAVWWMEHIIKYGGDHLIPPSAYLKWTEYYEVELVLICLSVALTIVFLLACICKKLFKYFMSCLEYGAQKPKRE